MKLFIKRLAQYSASSASFLFLRETNAQVAYTDLDPDYEFSDSFQIPLEIDFDLDGVREIKFEFNYSKVYTDSSHLKNSAFFIDNYWQVLNHNTYAPESGAVPFESCVRIDADDDFHSAPLIYLNKFYYHQYLLSSTMVTDASILGYWFDKSDRFLGFRFKIDTHYHYAWIRLTVDADTLYDHETHIYVKDYAYELTQSKPIIASLHTASSLILSDMSNTNSINDFNISFDAAIRESEITEYRVFVMDASYNNPVVNQLIDLDASRYTAVIPNGSSSYEVACNPGQLLTNSDLPPVNGNYYKAIILTVFDGDGCTSYRADSVQFILPEDVIPSPDNEAILMYSATNGLTVQLGETSNSYLNIYNGSGQLIRRELVDEKKSVFGLYTLPSGYYVAEVISDDKIYSLPFIKN